MREPTIRDPLGVEGSNSHKVINSICSIWKSCQCVYRHLLPLKSRNFMFHIMQISAYLDINDFNIIFHVWIYFHIIQISLNILISSVQIIMNILLFIFHVKIIIFFCFLFTFVFVVLLCCVVLCMCCVLCEFFYFFVVEFNKI